MCGGENIFGKRLEDILWMNVRLLEQNNIGICDIRTKYVFIKDEMLRNIVKFNWIDIINTEK